MVTFGAEPELLKTDQWMGGEDHYSLDGAVTFCALTHHVSLKDLLSLHSADWQVCVWLWLCRKMQEWTIGTRRCGGERLCLLPVRITRLCCLYRPFFRPFSAGSREEVSGRGSDFGSSGVMAGSLKPFTSSFSFVSTASDLQGRRPIGCPLRLMYLHKISQFSVPFSGSLQLSNQRHMSPKSLGHTWSSWTPAVNSKAWVAQQTSTARTKTRCCWFIYWITSVKPAQRNVRSERSKSQEEYVHLGWGRARHVTSQT